MAEATSENLRSKRGWPGCHWIFSFRLDPVSHWRAPILVQGICISEYEIVLYPHIVHLQCILNLVGGSLWRLKVHLVYWVSLNFNDAEEVGISIRQVVYTECIECNTHKRNNERRKPYPRDKKWCPPTSMAFSGHTWWFYMPLTRLWPNNVSFQIGIF